MFYILSIMITAFVTATMTREFPQARTRLGILSLVIAAVSVSISEVTGNLGFFYLGGSAFVYGMLMLLIRVVAAAFDEGEARLYRNRRR